MGWETRCGRRGKILYKGECKVRSPLNSHLFVPLIPSPGFSSRGWQEGNQIKCTKRMQDRKKWIHASSSWLPLWIRHLLHFSIFFSPSWRHKNWQLFFSKRPPRGESMWTKTLVESTELGGQKRRETWKEMEFGRNKKGEDEDAVLLPNHLQLILKHTQKQSLSLSVCLPKSCFLIRSISMQYPFFPNLLSIPLSTRVASLPFFVCLPRFVAIFMLHLLLSMLVSLRSLCLTESDACSLVSRSGSSSLVFFAKRVRWTAGTQWCRYARTTTGLSFLRRSSSFPAFFAWLEKTGLSYVVVLFLSLSSSLILKVIFSYVVTSDCRATRSLFSLKLGSSFKFFLSMITLLDTCSWCTWTCYIAFSPSTDSPAVSVVGDLVIDAYADHEGEGAEKEGRCMDLLCHPRRQTSVSGSSSFFLSFCRRDDDDSGTNDQ